MTGQDTIGRDRTQRDRKRWEWTGQDTRETGRDVVVTFKLWCCVCVFVTPKHELCNGLSVTFPDRTVHEAIGRDRM